MQRTKKFTQNNLSSKKIWQRLFVYGKKIGKKMNIKTEEDVLRIIKVK